MQDQALEATDRRTDREAARRDPQVDLGVDPLNVGACLLVRDAETPGLGLDHTVLVADSDHDVGREATAGQGRQHLGNA
jgi:hypothetical protein